jgi:hypothetical protein
MIKVDFPALDVPLSKIICPSAIAPLFFEPPNAPFHQRAFCLTIKINNPTQGFHSINALLLASGGNGC